MDRDRKREILAAENAERLARALAAKGVYVLGGLGRHGLGPASEGAEAVVSHQEPTPDLQHRTEDPMTDGAG